MNKDIEIIIKWRPSKSYDYSDYITNDKYVNGDYDNDYNNYKEVLYYEKRRVEGLLFK